MASEGLKALFKRWLADYGPAVGKVARAYTASVEESEDLAQEILLQVWRSLPQFQGQSRATTWFYRVALNTAISWQRKERRRRNSHNQLVQIDQMTSNLPDGPQLAAQKETVERIYTVIRTLSKTDAAILLLYLEELTYAEIAEVLGISTNHVGVKLHRAKQALSQRMKDRTDEL